MQFKMLRQSAVNSASTQKTRILSTVTSFECFTKAVHLRFVPSTYAFWQTVVKSEFVLLFMHRISITYNCLSTLLFMNSVTKKNEIKKIKIEKQKQKNIKINTTHFTCQSNKD